MTTIYFEEITDEDDGPGLAPDGSEPEVLATIGGETTDGGDACELPVHTLTAEDVARHKKAVSSAAGVTPDVSDAAPTTTSMPAKKADPAAVEALRLAGNEAFGAKRYPEAVEHYTEALSLDEDNGLIYGNRAAALLQLGKGSLGLADAKRMVLLLPDNPKSHVRLGGALSACDQPADACRAYVEALRLDPKNEQVAEALRKESARPALKKNKQHAPVIQLCQQALAARHQGAPGATTAA